MKKVYLLSIFLIAASRFSVPSSRASDILTSWTSVNAILTQPIANTQTLVLNDKLYVFGGSNSLGVSDTYFFPIHPNGSLGPRDNFSTPIPTAPYWSSVITLGGDIILKSGGTNFSGSVSSSNLVHYGNLNSSGSISSWTNGPNLPKPLSLGSSVVVGSWVYYLGGATWPGPTLSKDIYKAHINSDNSIGSWVDANIDLPTPLAAHGIFVNGSRMYTVGGSTTSSFGGTNKIYVFASDPVTGDLTRLTDEDELPFNSRSAMVTKVGNYIIHAGGVGIDTPSTNKVYFAPIDSTGNIGTWELSIYPLPQINCCTAITSWGNFIYITGGHDNYGPYYNTIAYTYLDLPEPPPSPQPAPIVLVPGMGASWNADALINCKDSGYEGGWSLAPYAEDIYNPLLQALGSSQHQVSAYYYDWRKNVSDHAYTLEEILQSFPVPAYLVGHSMGGLIGRSFLQTWQDTGNVSKLLTIGSPHKGSVLAYPVWSAGEVWDNNLVRRIAASFIINRCPESTTRQSVRNHFPSVQNLLAQFDYLYNLQTKSPIFETEMHARSNFPFQFSVPYFDIEINTLSGTGHSTIYKLDVKKPNSKNLQSGNWLDGDPVKKYFTPNGDGTVLVSSSQIPGAKNYLISGNHTDIIRTGEAVSKIFEILDIEKPASITSSEPADSAILIASTDADIEISPQHRSKSSSGISVILSPKQGLFNFSIDAHKDNSLVIVAKYLPNGKTVWKELLVNKGKRNGILRYDPAGATETEIEWLNL